jgi:hypothetical protein
MLMVLMGLPSVASVVEGILCALGVPCPPFVRYHVHRGPKWGVYDNTIGFAVVEFNWKGKGECSPPLPLTPTPWAVLSHPRFGSACW